MARPTKNTVDYFPHSCTHKETIFILEEKFGNDGYALWFKLLEKLGVSDGHSLDLRREMSLMYFSSVAKVPKEKALEILNLLASLGAIDAELWKKKIVWCDNFVKNISDAYTKRISAIPTKPIVSDTVNEVSDTVNSPNDTSNPQSKVKEIKVNNIKEEESEISDEISTPTPKHICDIFFSEKGEDLKNKTIDWIESNGVPRDLASSEIQKFISYWTEPNSTGKKQKWQMQKTFELRRRLSTWFQRSSQWSSSSDKRTEHQKRQDESLKKMKEQMGLGHL